MASLGELRIAAASCQACDLYRHATQTVFGEGPARARILFIGEQPGDQEDLQGHPFVGPAGKLLDRAIEEAELDRRLIYVTNLVKHFKFEQRGKRRIHMKPNSLEIQACRPWLNSELSLVRPEVVVCLGATAAQAMLGKSFRVTRERGVLLPHPQVKQVMATIHPSALLRMPDADKRREEYTAFVRDLRILQKYAA